MSTRIPERPKLWEGLVTTLVYGWLVAMVVVFAALALASVFDGELWTRPTENVDAIAMVGAGVVLLSIGFVIGALTAHSEARDTAEAEAQATAIAHEREVRHWKAAKDDLLEQRRSEKEWDARSRRHDRVYEIEARFVGLAHEEIVREFNALAAEDRAALAAFSRDADGDPWLAENEPLSTLLALHRDAAETKRQARAGDE